jgi:hypothetical protein
MFLIDDLLLLPMRGLVGILKEIHKYAEKETGDPDRLQEKLLEAQTLFEMDEITEEDYRRREEEIMDRLNTLEPAGSNEEFDPSPLTSGHERKTDQ